MVRRAVTRRGNLLPKTKGFARIRAALAEESAPVDAEVRREADTLKQVRATDTSVSFPTSMRSPGLLPAIPGLDDVLDDVEEETPESLERHSSTGESKGADMCFSTQAAQNAHANASYWNRLDQSFRTPPPPSFPSRQSTNLTDTAMESPISGSFNTAAPQEPFPSSEAHHFPVLTKTIGKRAREEDVEMSIKRRAVSPSLSVSNSPQIGQSPAAQARERPERQDSWGGPPKTTRENSGDQGYGLRPHRSNSGGSVSSMPGGGMVGPKRVGLQSMTDTNDGLMKMSIE